MTTTTIYRNNQTGYRVTLIDNGRGARVVDSLGYDFPMVGADYPHAATLARSRAHNNGAIEVPAVAAPVPVTSPLPVELQTRAARPLVSGVVGLPSLPQARCLLWSVNITPGEVADGTRPLRPIHRGRASVIGMTAPLDVLIAMSRRGWVTLDHPTMPMSATVTKAGHIALLAYITKHGEVQ